jgi:hypothetical protein
MDMVEKLVAKREADSGGQMRKSRFLRSGSSYVLEP